MGFPLVIVLHRPDIFIYRGFDSLISTHPVMGNQKISRPGISTQLMYTVLNADGRTIRVNGGDSFVWYVFSVG